MTSNVTAGKERGIASRSSPISILFALLEKGTKVKKRTGQEGHKQSASKLFSKAENTVRALVSKTLARIDIECFLTNITGVA